MTYPPKLIARIKGALRCGFRPKQISYWLGIPVDTIKNWAQEDSRATIEADCAVGEDMKLALMGEGALRWPP